MTNTRRTGCGEMKDVDEEDGSTDGKVGIVVSF